MANIFINGLNASSAGGKSIFNNYMRLLNEKKTHHKYFVLTPNASYYQKYNKGNIIIVDIPRFYNKMFLYPFVYGVYLNIVLKKYKINVVFNLADIPIRTKVKQVFLFDWSYAVYPNSVVWSMMDTKSKFIRNVKLYYFRKYLKYIDLLLAQSETIKKRLTDLFGVKDIVVVPNAVSLDNLNDKEHFNFKLPTGINLLYLTRYYTHKNLEVFIPLAKEIKKRGCNYKLITTIDSTQHPNARKFLEKVNNENLTDIIINVGPVDMKLVPSLYRQCDGLLMPTLLESFSGTYVEAMFHRIPIFTSDFDFAKGVCKNAAVYLDPFNEISILDNLESVFNDEDKREDLILNGDKVLKELPDWEQAFKLYNKTIEKVLQQ